MRSPVRIATLSLALWSLVFLSGALPRASVETGHQALGLALRRLNTAATFLMATAHPDDENNAVLALLARGLGARTVVVSATRGDGGQNEIGPELFDALAALRTEELLAAHRTDGAEQYFTRAVDFGYSFSVEETFDKWGEDEIVGDYVRHIRMLRPDVVVSMRPGGGGGGQHHQATARIAREAFKAAGDAARYPDQVKEGLRPWQAKKFYFMAAWGARGEPVPTDKKLLSVPTGDYDPLLGRTYAEAGSLARSMHKCQGFGQLLVLPGQAGTARYELVEAADPALLGRDEESFFDGVDVSVEGISQYGAGTRAELAAIARDTRAAQKAFERGENTEVVNRLVAGLEKIRTLRRSDPPYEVAFRVEQKERQFEEALVLAHALRIEALAGDGIVAPGQPVKAEVIVANRSGFPATVKDVRIKGMATDGPVPCASSEPGVTTCGSATTIPADASLTDAHWTRLPDRARYTFRPDVPFGAAFAPSPFRARMTLDLSGAEVTIDRPLEHRYEGNIFSGEKRMELAVVPRLAVAMAPEIAIIPLASRGRDLTVTVVNSGKEAAQGSVRIEVPAGWTVTPATAAVNFAREDEAQTVRFTVSPPAAPKTGEYSVRAVATLDGREFDRGYEVVEYPHIQRRHLIREARSTLKILDVKVAPRLTVGYVIGVGDQVAPAIEQLGATLLMLGPEDLASGDLSRFDAIVTGVRAYERRSDLRAHNQRLIEYAQRGGTVIVQYNKFEFNQAQYAPFPAKVSSNRVTDENSVVRVLAPAHPVFTTPNPIDDSAWSGWVQERGLYFLGDRDPRYVDLVELEDPFEYNKGPKRGALVEARVGKGRWIYVGLGLWRQLPAGTPGAYALMANLIGLK
ncbi:MAG TPA: PIG-L family deacetylase [Vicinamibacterales bacterium]|nr:PIG-L family deacetylase [Vicinamibacterales bacterium]